MVSTQDVQAIPINVEFFSVGSPPFYLLLDTQYLEESSTW